MGRRPIDEAGRIGSVLLAAAAAVWAGDRAMANPLVHLKSDVWGCVDPNVAPALNDDGEPRRTDRQWVARTAALGECVRISTRSVWEPLSTDHNGLTYVAYRGATGKPGSFWVPTSAIDPAAPVQAATPPPPAPSESNESSAPPIQPARSRINPAVPHPTRVAHASAAQVETTQPTPAPETAEASASGPRAADKGSATGGITVLAMLSFAAWGIRRALRRPKAPIRSGTSGKGQATTARGESARRVGLTISLGGARPDVRPTVPATSARGSPRAKTSAVWHPPGDAVTVAGATVPDGMVYVGRGGRPGDHDSSFIDPALPVARSPAAAGPLGYWPSYAAISPECRRRYIGWLASGKRDPDADLGYVFLYFYGLERRLLLEEPTAGEARILVAELERLRTIYAHSRSFEGYSRRLIEASAFIRSARVSASAPFVPDLAAPAGEMPLALKVAIAREVVAGRPLGFELAAASLFGLRDFASGYPHVTGKARPAFLDLLRIRFSKIFPSGFPLRNRKDSRLQLGYHGASAGLQLDLASRLGLEGMPDLATLTWTKLLAHGAAVAMEIAPYAKALNYHPARANSLAGLASCPLELRGSVASEARRWLEGLPSPAAVTFGELAGHALGTSTGKWTLRHRRDVSGALSNVGYAMEPDPEDGAERIEDGTVIQIFRCPGSTKSRHMEVAFAAAMLVVAVSRTADVEAAGVADHWLSRLPSRMTLTADQTVRLRARLFWLDGKPVTLAKAKRALGGGTPDEREFCAWSATAAAGATGRVSKPQVALLEAIHDALEVPRDGLYAGLHAGAGAGDSTQDEPVLVSDDVPKVPYPPPRVSAADPVDLNSGRLARVRAETERVSALLADIFVEEEQVPQRSEPADEGMLSGLDARHAGLVSLLSSRGEWQRVDFDGAAKEAGLMPGGAMETINEWAFDRFGDALLEGEDAVAVNSSLLLSRQGAVAAE